MAGGTQLLSQERAGAMQPRANSPHSATENFGCLDITHFLQVAKHYDFAVALGQSQHSHTYLS